MKISSKVALVLLLFAGTCTASQNPAPATNQSQQAKLSKDETANATQAEETDGALHRQALWIPAGGRLRRWHKSREPDRCDKVRRPERLDSTRYTGTSKLLPQVTE